MSFNDFPYLGLIIIACSKSCNNKSCLNGSNTPPPWRGKSVEAPNLFFLKPFDLKITRYNLCATSLPLVWVKSIQLQHLNKIIIHEGMQHKFYISLLLMNNYNPKPLIFCIKSVLFFFYHVILMLNIFVLFPVFSLMFIILCFIIFSKQNIYV